MIIIEIKISKKVFNVKVTEHPQNNKIARCLKKFTGYFITTYLLM